MLLRDGITCAISPNTSETVLVGPFETHALGDLLDHRPILARLARRAQRGTRDLHLPVGVGEGAPLLGVKAEAGSTTSAWQAVSVRKKSCTTRCSSCGQRLARMLHVGVRHGWVLAHTYMPLITPSWIACMISTTVRPRLGRASCPRTRRTAADGGILDRFVVGKEHGDEAGVGGALHVVLAAQGVQASAGSSDLAGDQRQRNQAARIVGTVGVLARCPCPRR